MIDRFDGEFRWLSNFAESPIRWDCDDWPTVEHAFQASKAVDPKDREAIRLAATPGRAKRLGRKAQLRPDWDEVKLSVMRGLLHAKFTQHPELAAKLIATGNQPLVEGNHWGDRFWGVCDGEGQNHLGKLLMELRSQLIPEES